MKNNSNWRLHRAYINLLGLAQGVSFPAEHPPLTRVRIEPAAKRSLLKLLELKGRTQYGVIFGRREGETLHVVHFAHLESRGTTDSEPTPFSWAAPSYLLGCTDTLIAILGDDIDWHGTWVIAPNAQAFTFSEAIDCAAAAYATGMTDDQQVFLHAGWDEGSLVVQAFKHMDDTTPVDVPVHF